MAKGLQFLHNLNVVHGNLHGANVLVSQDGQAKIADYICPKMDTLNENTTSQNTNYMSPESITTLTTNPISKSSDVYSLGVLCLQVATQNPPIPDHGIEVSDLQQWKEQIDQIKRNPILPLIVKCFKLSVARPHIDHICTKIVAIKENFQITVYNNEVCKYITISAYHTI